MKRVISDLNSVVMRAINGVEAGETKQEAVQAITSFVKNNYIKGTILGDIGNLPLEEAMFYHEAYGTEFDIRNGKVEGIRFRENTHNENTALVG